MDMMNTSAEVALFSLGNVKLKQVLERQNFVRTQDL